MNILLLFFWLEAGLIPVGGFDHYRMDQTKYFNNSFYIDFNIETNFYMVEFGGNLKTYIWKSLKGNGFRPSGVDYKIYIQINVLENLSIGFRHFCTHPVIPYMEDIDNYLTIYEGGYEELYIRFESTNKNKQ